MDSIFFGMKRADQVALRFGHKMLAPFGLTPARFDMLFAMDHGYSSTQRELRRELGVARSTASRMLASLERLGWVEREPRRHTRRIRLTEAGRVLIRRAARRLRGSRRLPYRMVSRAVRVGPRTNVFMARDALEGSLARFRRTFGDGATLYYSWYEDH